MRQSPLLARRGGCAIKKKVAKHFSGADGVVVQIPPSIELEQPPRPLHKWMLRNVSRCRGHPSWPGGAIANLILSAKYVIASGRERVPRIVEDLQRLQFDTTISSRRY
jgi:hypothetical protein